MSTPKAKFAGLALIAVLCDGFTLGLTAPAFAGFDEGWGAYNRGDYATALREWRPLAEQGDAKAQYNLGFMYRKGQGMPQDYAKSLQWYRKAAEQGYAKAQYNLGHMYDKGLGVPQDDAEAVKWYRKAAAQGHAGGQNNLGLMYGTGLGVPQDYVQAHKWYNIAATSLPPGKNHDTDTKNRDIVANKITPADVSKAHKLAREWRPKKSGTTATLYDGTIVTLPAAK